MDGHRISIEGTLITSDYIHFTIDDHIHNETHSFTGSKSTIKCLPGDTVIWKDDICQLSKRIVHPPIVGTIELTNKIKYGVTSRGYFKYLFVPYSLSYPQMVVGCSEKDLTCNKIGIAQFTSWSIDSQFPDANLIRIIGNSGDILAEEDAILQQYCPYKNKSIVPVDTTNEHSRKHLEGVTFNVDPPGCQDIDDVITVAQLSTNKWCIVITISDVSSIIPGNSDIDNQAMRVGQTFYKDGIAIRPMLPASISEYKCSLIPGKLRNGVSLEFVWDNNQKYISNINWVLTTVINNSSYTYEEFQNSEYAPLINNISVFLEKGVCNDSHKWIESLMKFYNQEAGKLLKSAGHGILRKHMPPDIEKLDKYINIRPELAILAQSSAIYCNASDPDTGHYGLNTDAYCHITSPIRRYADLFNQRILKKIIGVHDDTIVCTPDINTLNSRSRACKLFERDLIYMRAVIGNESRTLNGTIIDIIEQAIDTVSLPIYKIKIYVEEWRRIISCKYTKIEEGIIISKDCKTKKSIYESQKVHIQYAIHLIGRRWKDRIIFTIL